MVANYLGFDSNGWGTELEEHGFHAYRPKCIDCKERLTETEEMERLPHIKPRCHKCKAEFAGDYLSHIEGDN